MKVIIAARRRNAELGRGSESIQEISVMKNQKLVTLLQVCAIVFAVVGVWPSIASAQDGHSQMMSMHHDMGYQSNSSALIKTVRDATARFQDVSLAKAEGYSLLFGCVSGPDEGAMGMHFVNAEILNSGIIDPRHPQILLYEPQPNGRLKLTGADFLVFASSWDAAHPNDPPQIMGQLFQFFDAPNRFGLPPFYTLHVWAWKSNPNGSFVNWNPKVTCEAFNGQGQ